MTHSLPKKITEEEIEEYMSKIQEEDPLSIPLEVLSAESSKNWLIKLEGDNTLISSSNGESTSNRQVVHLKNKNWKGSHIVYDQHSYRWVFFYCGFALNNNQGVYPLRFYTIQNSPKDLKECPEPNGKIEEEKVDETQNNETESDKIEDEEKNSQEIKDNEELEEMEEVEEN